MPPRRSSRVVKAEPSLETLPVKRKRGQTADPEAEAEEKENVAKPPSRTTRRSGSRSSLAPPSKGRSSTLTRAALPEVHESDEEEEQGASPPKRKKARPSDETEVDEEDKEEEEEEEEVVKPAKGRRGAAPRRGRVAKMVVDEEEEEQEEELAPKPAARRASRKPASAASKPSTAPKRASRSSRSKKVQLEEEDEEQEEEAEEEEEAPKKPTRRSSKVIISAASKASTAEGEDKEEEDEPPKKPASRNTRRSSKATISAASKATTAERDSDEGEEEPPKNPASKTTRRSSKATISAASKASTAQEAEEDDEEEPPKKPASKNTRRSSKATISAASKATTAERDSDDEMFVDDEEEEDVKPARRGRKSKAAPAPARKGRVPAKKKPEPVLESDEEVENELAPPSAQPPKEKTPASAEPEPVVEEEEDEEKSLFDPVPMPHPSQLPTSIPEPTGPKPRLVIHKMALVNFKSYAGRQEIGPFHKSFSAIVGPNGSGKSNTIDALLFVFGYRASKMRQAKVSELIHNSANYPDLDECSVEVHFKEIIDLPGPDAFEEVPGSKLVVTRQAFKNNSSRYTINGKSSTYSEVQVLLKGRGIDLDHKRFLILQGEVESIAQMKPKGSTEHEDGLLEYLEDIIGTSKYKEPIDEALVEMERLQEDRQQKLNRLKLVEKEKSALEAAKREAEDYLRLKNDHVRALSRLWQWYIWKCLLAEEDYEGRISRFSKELEEETERNKDDIQHLDALKKHYEEREEAYAELQVATAKALKDLAAYEKQEVGLQERYKHAKGKAKKLSKSVADDTAAKQTASRTLDDSSAKIEKEKKKLDEYEDSLADEEKLLEKIRDSLKDKTQGFHDQIEAKQKELQPWTAKINKKQADIDVATSERDALAEKAKALKEASLEAEETLQGLQGDQEVKVTEYKKLQSRKTGLTRDIEAAEGTVKSAQAKVQQYRGKATASRQKVDEARASQSENRSQNRVLDSLTRLKQQGRIQGFHGRLGSLGTIPEKYDVAITTACGMLNHMVVDKVEQGQECIQYLRSQNIGRASFMIMDKLSNSRGMDKISTPENVPRLFDLIKPKEPRFAAAFYKAIGDTLVANDLEQANRIAYGARRWRVVTLAGQMIETSGVMSGGGHNPMKGGMSSKLAKEAVAPEMLQKLERDTEQDARLLQEAQQELQAAEAELDRLTRSGPEIDMALQKLSLDIENGKKRISEAEKRLRDVKAQSKPNSGDLARISELEDNIAEATSELENLQAKSSKIEDAIKALEKKILDIGGAKLLSQKSKVDGIRLHINIANDEITKAEVAKSKAEKDLQKFENSIKTNSAALEEVQSELEELKEKLTELMGYVSELREEVEKAQTAEENSKEDLDKIKADVDEREEEIAVFRKKEMELKQKITDAEKERKENDKILTHWQEQHDRLTLEEIDDDDDEEEAPAEEQAAEDADGDVNVKPEPGEQASKVKKERPSSTELQVYSTEELSKMKKADLLGDAEYLDEKIKNAKPDLSVLKEYKRREEEFLNRAKDLEHTTNERDAKKAQYDGLRKQRLDEFMAGFNLISLKLKEMYQMITLGGNAELELVDSLDPFSEGIIFSVMPPKKSWKNISNLSGGEKTLSSLALVFALHVFKPTPLYFMDEIDAALDFRNVSIVANYIKDRTKNAQFIIISLRNDMFELSHRLIGIYKTANTTKSISIDNHSLMAAPSARPPAAHPPASTATS